MRVVKERESEEDDHNTLVTVIVNVSTLDNVVFVSAAATTTDPARDLYGSRLLISTSSSEIRQEFLPARSRKADGC